MLKHIEIDSDSKNDNRFIQILLLCACHPHSLSRDNSGCKVATIWRSSDGILNSIDIFFIDLFYTRVVGQRHWKLVIVAVEWMQVMYPKKKKGHYLMVYWRAPIYEAAMTANWWANWFGRLKNARFWNLIMLVIIICHLFCVGKSRIFYLWNCYISCSTIAQQFSIGNISLWHILDKALIPWMDLLLIPIIWLVGRNVSSNIEVAWKGRRHWENHHSMYWFPMSGMISGHCRHSQKKCYNDVDPLHPVSFWRFLDRHNTIHSFDFNERKLFQCGFFSGIRLMLNLHIHSMILFLRVRQR